MTRSEFVDEVARKAQVPRAAAQRVVKAIFDAESGAIAEAVEREGSLSIRGFGKFTRERRAVGHGGRSRVPEDTTVAFEPSARLNGRAAAQIQSSDPNEITPEEAAIRRMLVEGFERVRGMEIDNVFPGGWADERIPR